MIESRIKFNVHSKIIGNIQTVQYNITQDVFAFRETTDSSLLQKP